MNNAIQSLNILSFQKKQEIKKGRFRNICDFFFSLKIIINSTMPKSKKSINSPYPSHLDLQSVSNGTVWRE